MPEIDTWAARMRAEGLSDRTVEERTRILRQCAHAAGKSAAQLDEDDIVDWLASPTFSRSTRAKYFGAIRTFSIYLLRTGRRHDDPTERLRTPRVPHRQPRPVADENLEAILGSRMHHRTRVMIHLMAYQGLRRHEVAKFRGEDIDLRAGTLTVLGKGDQLAVLPLHPVIRADAASMPHHGWWFPAYEDPNRPVKAHSVGGVVARAMRRAGVDATGHQLRHWYGTSLLGEGVDVRIVQELMRHLSLSSTQIYTLVHADQQRAGLAKLRPIPERQPRRSEVREAA